LLLCAVCSRGHPRIWEHGQSFENLRGRSYEVHSATKKIESLDEDHELEEGICENTNVKEEEIFAENIYHKISTIGVKSKSV
jgi:hypothetical protein